MASNPSEGVTALNVDGSALVVEPGRTEGMTVARATVGFANQVWSFREAEGDFEARLNDTGLTEYKGFRYDSYDCSIEIDGAPKDLRLTDEQQRIFFDAKFATAYVNHEDGWETHYSWAFGKPFEAKRGWRRLRIENGFLISYWPEAWGDPLTGKNADWLRGGYMTIVPDTVAPATATPPASTSPATSPQSAATAAIRPPTNNTPTPVSADARSHGAPTTQTDDNAGK